MNTTTIKNKTNVFSFYKKVFLSTMIVLFTLSFTSCKKDINITPAPVEDDNELAENPYWRGDVIDKTFQNSGVGNSLVFFDIDNDNNADFSVVFVVNADHSYHIKLNGLDNNKLVMADDTIIQSYLNHEIINSKSKIWQDQTNVAYFYNNRLINAASDATGISTAGIYFMKDGKMHYGWLRFQIIPSRGNIHAIYFIDYGYEVAENKAIEAGHRNDV